MTTTTAGAAPLVLAPVESAPANLLSPAVLAAVVADIAEVERLEAGAEASPEAGETATVMTPLDEERLALWKLFKTDINNLELRNKLVEIYLPLVRYNGERIWSRLPEGVELDDLISAGVFGLMDAI